jgi:hypothetical protein
MSQEKPRQPNLFDFIDVNPLAHLEFVETVLYKKAMLLNWDMDISNEEFFDRYCEDDELISLRDSLYDKPGNEEIEKIYSDFSDSFVGEPSLEEMSKIYQEHPDSRLKIYTDRNCDIQTFEIISRVKNPQYKTPEEMKKIKEAGEAAYNAAMIKFREDLSAWEIQEKNKKIRQLEKQLKELRGEK